MESCRIPHRVLLLFILMFITVHVSAETIVRGQFNQSVVLPCTWSCSGLAKWTPFSFSTDILAECDQTSCQSWEEGFNMSHDQYLKGDLNLTITAADHSKRDLYTCHCDDMDIGDVRLTIETVTSSGQMNPGEDLLLELYAFDSLEVIYKNKDSADGKQICTVYKSSVHCNVEYRQRISLANMVLKLRGVKPSDEGVYTIHEKDTDEDLYVYTLSVTDTDANSVQKRALPKWVSILIVVVLLVVLLFGALLGIILHQRKQIKYYQGALVLSDETDVEMSQLTMNE
ncbi:uncharacterized protein Hap1MRO34_007383 [Clarias gariepinus]|uniref:uncharacterized protein LOC128523876 n=1 Tax=Clarias gariepinus TaxID=13013 RepID=UPI00234C3AD8|nr:uncharacterized protein LOC128523876 [Clarias gariepinus]XP_053352021.1 uncharacterized protein LOC128523876 [Clarias gariepinus]